MNHIEILKKKLILLATEVNEGIGSDIKFNQQKEKKENMSFFGGNGRIGITPFHDQYDICLSGESIEKQMYNFMVKLCEKENNGYKQTKPKPHAPFWRVSDFDVVKKSIYHYAKSKK